MTDTSKGELRTKKQMVEFIQALLDDFAKQSASLTAAAERAEKAEAETKAWQADAKKWVGEFKAALDACSMHRARVAALEGALTRIRDGVDSPEAPQLGCGVEDRDLQADGYGGAEYGWNDAEERFLEWARNEASAVLTAPAPQVSQAAADVFAEVERLRTRVMELETADQFWAAEDPEDSYATDPEYVVEYCDPPEGVAVKLLRSRSLPVEWAIALPTKLDDDGEVEESDVHTFPSQDAADQAYAEAVARLDRAAEREG